MESGSFGETAETILNISYIQTDIDFLRWTFFEVAKTPFAADPVHSRSADLHAGASLCFSKLGVCQLPSPVGHTLTVDKHTEAATHHFQCP